MDTPSAIAAELARLIRASHLLEPDDLPAAVAESGRRAGATDVRVLLADYEQVVLNHLPTRGGEAIEPQTIDGTLAGRVYRTLEPVGLAEDDGHRVLVPLLDGTHRLGVLDVRLPAGRDADPTAWEPLAGLIAELVISKASVGDVIATVQRRRPAAVRAEAQRALLPPLTSASERVLVTGMLVPSYEVAGDVFDHAFAGDTLHVAIFDAMGHSLSATLTATVALAAYRNSRRAGGSIVEHCTRCDQLVNAEFGGERFATSLIAELDLVSGTLRTVSAGHPSALVVRGNRVVAYCADDPTLPIGLGGGAPQVTTTQLEPMDRLLLFTDGVTEARDGDGEFFGEDRLVEQIAKELDSGLPPAEAVRRVLRAVAEHQSGNMRDDATLLLVEWRGPGGSADRQPTRT